MTEFATDADPGVDAPRSENDLIWAFIRKQMELWGEGAVQKMLDQGFDAKMVNGKVLWVK